MIDFSHYHVIAVSRGREFRIYDGYQMREDKDWVSVFAKPSDCFVKEVVLEIGDASNFDLLNDSVELKHIAKSAF